MAFTLNKGKTKTAWYPLPVSSGVTFAKGDILSLASGYIIKATSSTAALSHIGVAHKTVAATDSDYAVARMVPVQVPVEKNVTWKAPVTSGLVAADVGLLIDLTDAGTVNRAASTYDVAMVAGVISSTEGIFILNLLGATGEVNG